jgi:hypothetical protein
VAQLMADTVRAPPPVIGQAADSQRRLQVRIY